MCYFVGALQMSGRPHAGSDGASMEAQIDRLVLSLEASTMAAGRVSLPHQLGFREHGRIFMSRCRHSLHVVVALVGRQRCAAEQCVWELQMKSPTGRPS